MSRDDRIDAALAPSPLLPEPEALKQHPKPRTRNLGPKPCSPKPLKEGTATPHFEGAVLVVPSQARHPVHASLCRIFEVSETWVFFGAFADREFGGFLF